MSGEMLLYITCENTEQAQTIARALLESRLIACANILAPMQSLYHWEDAVREESEIPLIAKTSAAKTQAAIDAVKELHGYECPCVIALPIADGNPDFLQWINDETQ